MFLCGIGADYEVLTDHAFTNGRVAALEAEAPGSISSVTTHAILEEVAQPSRHAAHRRSPDERTASPRLCRPTPTLSSAGSRGGRALQPKTVQTSAAALAAGLPYKFAATRIDPRVTDLRAVRSLTAHEIGHTMGLDDCAQCCPESTVMNSQPDLNDRTGVADGPTACDAQNSKARFDANEEAKLVDDDPPPTGGGDDRRSSSSRRPHLRTCRAA